MGNINYDGSGYQYVILGSAPQTFSASEIVYVGIDDSVNKVGIDGTSNVRLFSNYVRSTLNLSFDNTKIVGGDLITGGGSHIGGIWVTNINDGISIKIR